MFLFKIFPISSAYYKLIIQEAFTTQVSGHINFGLDFLKSDNYNK